MKNQNKSNQIKSILFISALDIWSIDESKLRFAR